MKTADLHYVDCRLAGLKLHDSLAKRFISMATVTSCSRLHLMFRVFQKNFPVRLLGTRFEANKVSLASWADVYWKPGEMG
jgi:hypothetical protein